MSDSVILHGDAFSVLATLPSDSIDCCVTSPPYWGLRDYGVAGQLGLEVTFAEYLVKLVAIFEEVRRVLTPRGTCWVNMGDAYYGSGKGYNNTPCKQDSNIGSRLGTKSTKGHGKPKDLIGQPWSLAFAMRDAGWWLREDIVWHKPNPMPESILDRCTRSHEMIFHFTKSKSYYHDADAIRTKMLAPNDSTQDDLNRAFNNKRKTVPVPRQDKLPTGWDIGSGAHGTIHRAMRTRRLARAEAEPLKRKSTLNEPMGDRARHDQSATGANRRSVWTIATCGYSGAHFATFPPELPRLCILAGCPPGGMVLDPFAGSGTVGDVAVKLGRKFTLIELNAKYLTLINERLGLFAPGLLK